MPGRGQPPKDPATRARGNKSTIPTRTVQAKPARQPPLPTVYRTEYSAKREQLIKVRVPWPAQTIAWWKMWGASPLSKEFIANDWSELLDTALLHAQVWNGDTKAASELRLRVAKFGATPEDRARLRITLEPPGPKAPAKKASASRSRFGDLKVVQGGRASSTG